MNTLMFMFKIKHNMAPNYLASKLLYTREATTRELRNAVGFRLPRYNRTYTQKSLWHAGLNEFNKLPFGSLVEHFIKSIQPKSSSCDQQNDLEPPHCDTTLTIHHI
jgi:hypothetical protein